MFQRLSFDLVLHRLQKSDARNPLLFPVLMQIVNEANSFHINDIAYMQFNPSSLTDWVCSVHLSIVSKQFTVLYLLFTFHALLLMRLQLSEHNNPQTSHYAECAMCNYANKSKRKLIHADCVQCSIYSLQFNTQLLLTLAKTLNLLVQHILWLGPSKNQPGEKLCEYYYL